MADSAFRHDPSLSVPTSNVLDNAIVIFDGTSGYGFDKSTILVDSGGTGRIGISADPDVIVVTNQTVTIGGTLAATTLTAPTATLTNGTNANAITFNTGATAANYTITMPTAVPTAAGQVLQTTGSSPYSVLEWATPTKGLQNFVSTSTSAVFTTSTSFPIGDAVAQNDDGAELFTLAITPTSASNTLIIEATVVWSINGSGRAIGIGIFQDSTAGALAAVYSRQDTSATPCTTPITHVMAAGTTSSTTFKVRVGPNGDTLTVNGESGGRRLGGVAATTFRIWEVTV